MEPESTPASIWLQSKPLSLPCLHACSAVSDSVTPWTIATRLLWSWGFPGKKAGVGCHFLLQGIFPAQGLNPCLLGLLHWQAVSLLLSHPAALPNSFLSCPPRNILSPLPVVLTMPGPLWNSGRLWGSPAFSGGGQAESNVLTRGEPWLASDSLHQGWPAWGCGLQSRASPVFFFQNKKAPPDACRGWFSVISSNLISLSYKINVFHNSTVWFFKHALKQNYI